MPRGTVRKRCPYCDGTHTKRHSILVLKKFTLHGLEPVGVQRWYCHDCRRAFTPPHPARRAERYSLDVAERAALLSLDQGASYRAVARELRRLGLPVDARRAWHLVQGLAARCKAPWEVSRELHPQWAGYLVVDADSLPIGSHRESLLLGVDVASLDVPHVLLAPTEDVEHWLWFFLVLRHTLGYPLKGLVSDGEPAIDYALTLVWPEVPHQLCVRHFHARLERYLRYSARPPRQAGADVQRFQAHVRACLYAYTLEDARRHLAALRTDPGVQRWTPLADLLTVVTHNFGALTQHFHHPGLPRTSNAAEGMIRKLDRRLTPMDSFGRHQTAWNILKLLALYLRWKPLTDCRDLHKYRNGFCPLQLLSVA